MTNLDAISHPQIFDLVSFWLDHFENGLPPEKHTMKPEVLWPWLGNLNIIETDKNQERFLLRLAGTNVAHNMGIDTTGKYMDEFIPAPYQETFFNEFRQCLNDSHCYYYRGMVPSQKHGFCDFHRVIMPLSNSLSDKQFILGAIFFQDADDHPIELSHFWQSLQNAKKEIITPKVP